MFLCLFLDAYIISSMELKKEEMFYLTTYSTHFIYEYIPSDICGLEP